ncbi:integumentary mucin C.1-like isoform X2 [Haliotis rubra]|nr:integumentary mucin C.1-like isoform X2 [Haliotis rubra]XP_046571017.1 integumentary mucin C.1-like isoform X2 [Haliotis rubra]XP_046571018.1 integumentary mucin C.1-like isoform X2 [Haliotis rubra]XP_046571019.1 integumentary mucin C.1-like isoform X2 [Haliotis rubra]
MCKGGAATDRQFYLHGSPAGGVQRCDCYLTIAGVATTVYFTPVSVTNTSTTCGGKLTLQDGSRRDCGWTSTTQYVMYPGTSVVSFAYNAPDIRFCVEVKVTAAAASVNIECPLSTTTTTTLTPSTTTPPQTTTVNVISSSISTTTASLATSPLHVFTSSSTSTPSSTKPLSTSTYTTVLASTTGSTTVLSSENRSSSPVTNTQSGTDDSKPEGTTVEHTSFPGLLIAGWVIAAVVVSVNVVVVVLLIRKQRQSKYESRATCQQSVSTQTDGGSIYEMLDQNNVTKPDTLYERIETQSAAPGVKDYYNIEMGDYCNP